MPPELLIVAGVLALVGGHLVRHQAGEEAGRGEVPAFLAEALQIASTLTPR